MKLEENMYLYVQFGPAYRKQTWYMSMSISALIAAENFNLSKSQVKRLIKEGGVTTGFLLTSRANSDITK